jgi:hypothetical protein
MTRIEYASELDPLLDLSLPPDWLVAVVPEPGQLLTESDLPEDRLFARLLSDGDGERIVATRLGFLYSRGIGPDRETSSRDNQISVRYDFPTAQYELWSVLGETTVQSPDAAATWVADQFLAVETFVDTYLVLIDLAEEIHGLGRTGVRGLVETFETVDAMREADVDALAAVPYINEKNARALQTGLDAGTGVGEDEPTPFERELQSVDGPLILDLQEGLISGELVPSGASEPKYRVDTVGSTEPDDR